MISDNNVYIKRRGDEFLVLAITVDYFYVNSKSDDLYVKLVTDLSTNYTVKETRIATKLIVWLIIQRPVERYTQISQPKLTGDFIRTVNMKTDTPDNTPYCRGNALYSRQTHEDVLPAEKPYAHEFWIILYIVESTRPYLAYDARRLARNLNNLTAPL